MKKKKQVLGRGLTALLGENLIAEDNLTNLILDKNQNQRLIKHIPVEDILPGPWQSRKIFSKDELEALADSIKQQGLINPIILSKQKEKTAYFIIAGERRWRACQIAKMHEVPAIIYENIDDNKASEISLLENVQRKDLSILEESRGYKELIDKYKYTQERVARTLGKSRSHITNILRLLKLPNRVLKLLEENKISFGHARALIENPLAEEISFKIVKEKLSVRETEKLIKTFSLNKEKKDLKNKNSSLEDVENEITNILGQKVKINYNNYNKTSKIIINCSTDEQLNFILQKLGFQI